MGNGIKQAQHRRCADDAAVEVDFPIPRGKCVSPHFRYGGKHDGCKAHAPENQFAAAEAEFSRCRFDAEVHDGKTEGGDDNPCGTERILIRGLVHFDING